MVEMRMMLAVTIEEGIELLFSWWLQVVCLLYDCISCSMLVCIIALFSIHIILTMTTMMMMLCDVSLCLLDPFSMTNSISPFD